MFQGGYIGLGAFPVLQIYPEKCGLIKCTFVFNGST